MSLLKRFIDTIQNENLFQKKDNLILAVSGGIDSVVLCELCREAEFSFEIAHCNFQLRGEESNRDEAFVRHLGEKYKINVLIKQFNTEQYAAENKLSIQVAARELRYNWFYEILNEAQEQKNKNPTFILTAHHANDNVETLLMNFFKGTGIKGLRGILPKQGKIIRPLLFAKKEEILSFADDNNLGFVQDSSNLSEKYTRNYFRLQLIPSLQQVFPRAEENLIDNLGRFKDIDILYHQAVDWHKKKLLEYKGNELHIPVLKLLRTRPLKTVVYEIIREYGFTAHQAEEVLHLLRSESGKYISSASHKIIRNRKWLIIAPQNNLESSMIVINEKDRVVDFTNGKLIFEKLETGNQKIPGDTCIAMLDADTFTFPLILRKWKQGDYFYPLGMVKKKKVSRFFIDQKLSLTDKGNAWVIESNKKIIWIVGKRIDERFKVTPSSTRLLKIHFTAL